MRRSHPLPLRWDAVAPPADFPFAVPPARQALVRGGRPLKRWRFVAALCDELMLCAAEAAGSTTRRGAASAPTGALPGVGAVHGGLGVMEHHRARW